MQYRKFRGANSTDQPPLTPPHRTQRHEGAAMVVRPSGFAWKEGELRLATSPTRSGPHSTRLARCAAPLASTYESRGVRRHHQHLQLALFEHASLPLRLLSSLPCDGTHKATWHKGGLERQQKARSVAGGLRRGAVVRVRDGWAVEGCSRQREARLLKDESGIEMRSVYGHCPSKNPV